MRISLIIIAAFMAMNCFAQGAIDVHSHIITPEFVSSLENETMIVRLAEIEVYPQHLKEYHSKSRDNMDYVKLGNSDLRVSRICLALDQLFFL